MDHTPEMNPDTAHDAGTAAPVVGPEPAAAQPSTQRSFISKGEKATNIATYGGVDWLFNAATGVGFAFWGNRTPSGQKKWSEPVTGFFKKALKPMIKNAESLEKSAGYGNLFASIIMGGMATLPPLLVLEHHSVKKAITKSFDRMIYGRDTVENDPKFQQAYQEIDEAPKKRFWMGMGTRFIALSPLLAVVLIPQTRKLSDTYYFNPLAKATQWLSKTVGLQPKKLMELRPGQAVSDWNYIHGALAMDFGLGPFYAVLHSYFYNKFSGHSAEKKSAGAEATAPALTVAPPPAADATEKDLPVPAHTTTHAQAIAQQALLAQSAVPAL